MSTSTHGLWKCADCHHEWEGDGTHACEWCKCTHSRLLERGTPLSRLVTALSRGDYSTLLDDLIEVDNRTTVG